MNLNENIINCIKLAKKVGEVQNRSTSETNISNDAIWLKQIEFNNEEDAQEVKKSIDEIINTYNKKYLTELKKELALKFADVEDS